MEQQAGTSVTGSPRGLRSLVRLVWAGVMDNRGLVVAILALGVLQAFFSKAPLVLLEPLMNALAPASGGPGSLTQGFTAWFGEFSEGLCQALGIELTGTEAEVRQKSLCIGCAIVIVVIGPFGAASIYGALVLTRYFAVKLVVDLRNRIGAHILNLPLRFFGRRRMGDLISHITTDTTVLTRSFSLACDHVVVDPLLVLGNMCVIAFLLPEALWVILLMVPMMALPIVRLGRRVHRKSSKSLEAMGGATESMNQMLSGIRTVKAFQLEEQRLADFEGNNANYLRRTKGMLRAKAMSQSMLFAGYHVGFALILGVAAWFAIGNDLSLGKLAGSMAAVATTYTHVKRLSRAYNTLMESLGALDRVQALLDERPDVGSSDAGRVPEPLSGEVAFEGVSFAYGEEAVLHDVSFSARAGETVALVGPSGAGKSTALDLVARFYDPSSGRVLIGGEDLCELNLKAYRRGLAIVSQQPFLFNTTIRENIRFGRPDASAEEIETAAQAAQIHDFIQSLPDGYESLAGERGCNLSGGQMQRITIARAFLRNPAILILDEAMSSLDSESEAAVQRAVQNLMRGRTSFVIAHRLATVTSADQILVLDKGRIVERGTHARLMEGHGLYSRLSQLQQLD